jgi:hypothetical protein
MVTRSGKCIRLPERFPRRLLRRRRAGLDLLTVFAGVIELTYLELESCCLQFCFDSWRLPQEADGAADSLCSHAAARCEAIAVRPEHCCAGAGPSGPHGSQDPVSSAVTARTCAEQAFPAPESRGESPSGGRTHRGSSRAEIRHQLRPGVSFAGPGGQVAGGDRKTNSYSQPRMVVAFTAWHSGRRARISPAIPTGPAGVGFAAGL